VTTRVANRSGSLFGERLLRRIDLLTNQLTKRGQAILLRELRREIGSKPIRSALSQLSRGRPLTDSMIASFENVRLNETRIASIFADAFRQGGRATSKVYQNLTQFNTNHPRVLEWASTQSALKVQEINMATREGIRALISGALRQGVSSSVIADQLRSSIGLTFRQAQMVEEYRQRMFGRGISSGLANARASTYGQSLLTQRVNAIAETEMSASVEAGKVEYWSQAQEAGVIPEDSVMVWIIENDDRVDEQCAAMAFAESDIYGYFETPIGPQKHPPLHPHCRCQVVLESGEARSRSVTSELSRAGGFTVHLISGQKSPDGWMVAIPGHEARRAYGAMTDDWIGAHKSASRDLLSQEGFYWGGWVEETAIGRNVYLDVSRNVKSFDDAVALGGLYRQKSIYNLGTGETYTLATRSIEKATRTLIAMVIPKAWSGERVRKEFDLVVEKYLTNG